MAFLNSPPDWIIIGVLVLLIFGPNKVPELGRQLGKAVRDFRKVADEFTGATASIRSEMSNATETLRNEFNGVGSRITGHADRPAGATSFQSPYDTFPLAPKVGPATEQASLKIGSSLPGTSGSELGLENRFIPSGSTPGVADHSTSLVLSSLPPAIDNEKEQ